MDANMVTDDEAPNDDDSFVQLVSIAKKGDGFDGLCMTDPLMSPMLVITRNPKEDANMVTEGEAIASKSFDY